MSASFEPLNCLSCCLITKEVPVLCACFPVLVAKDLIANWRRAMDLVFFALVINTVPVRFIRSPGSWVTAC